MELGEWVDLRIKGWVDFRVDEFVSGWLGEQNWVEMEWGKVE